MATILLLSGPNLNLLGDREPEVYGTDTLDQCVAEARTVAEQHGHAVEHLQSNHEGALVDAVHAARGRCAALVVNPGALTHYSFALADALSAFDGVKVELHLSNPASREDFRRVSVTAPYVTGTVAGFGRVGYRLALEAVVAHLDRGGARVTGVDTGLARIAALPPMHVAARVTRLRARLADDGVDGLLVTRLPNIRYLTGFTGSAALLLVTADETVFVTDGRYSQQSREQVDAAGVDARVVIASTAPEQRAALAAAAQGLARLGLEAAGVTWAQQRTYAEWLSGIELVPTEAFVEDLRRVKEPAEVARIQLACTFGDEALAEMLPELGSGITERDFALSLELAMRRRGASGVSFDAIVASGPNAAKPHARPSTRSIGRGELVVLDFGCIVDGYCSDITRTVSVGDPGPDAAALWDLVAASQRAGRAAVQPGASCAAVDAASRRVIEDAGFGERFVHGTGHGVGLEIHEAPRVARTSDGRLEPGFVVTVEPGVYLPGVGGVRIEDTLVVTEQGAEPLTAFPKALIVSEGSQ